VRVPFATVPMWRKESVICCCCCKQRCCQRAVGGHGCASCKRRALWTPDAGGRHGGGVGPARRPRIARNGKGNWDLLEARPGRKTGRKRQEWGTLSGGKGDCGQTTDKKEDCRAYCGWMGGPGRDQNQGAPDTRAGHEPFIGGCHEMRASVFVCPLNLRRPSVRAMSTPRC
jgi:hypothetical protein